MVIAVGGRWVSMQSNGDWGVQGVRVPGREHQGGQSKGRQVEQGQLSFPCELSGPMQRKQGHKSRWKSKQLGEKWLSPYEFLWPFSCTL